MPGALLFLALLAGPQHIERPAERPRRVAAPDLPPIPMASPKATGHMAARPWRALCGDGTHAVNFVRADNCRGHHGIKSDRQT